MSPLQNACLLGAVALIPVHFAVASPTLAPTTPTRAGVTLRLNVVTSPALGNVAGAEVELRRLDAEGPLLRAVAGSDGQAEFAGLIPGRYRAVVRREGFGEAVAPNLQLSARSLVETRVVVLLAGGVPVGRVTDPSGRILSGARVCVAPPVAPRVGAAAEITAFVPNATQVESVCGVSAADGSIALPRIPYGHFKVSVEASGYGSINGELTDLRAGREPRAWVLTPAGTIAGRVVDGEGQAVAAVKVTFRDRVRGTTVDTTSAANGVFRSSELAAGSWRVEIEPAEHRGLLRDSVRVKSGQTTDLGTLRARAAGAVAGRIVGSGGVAVAGAEIRAVASDGVRKTLRSTTTDERGFFRLAGLGLGARLDLVVRPVPGFTARTFQAVEVSSKDLILAVDRTTRLTGVAKAEDGSVPPRAYVSVFPAAGHPALEANAGLAAAATVDPATGAFTVENVPSGGEVELRVYANGFGEATARVTVAEGVVAGPVELSIPAADTALRGRVVDRNGIPVVGASLGRAVTDDQGRFALDRANAATGKIVVTHSDYASAAHDISKEAADDAVLVLDAGGTVEGIVTDTDGQPIAGVKIAADAPGVTAVTGVGGKYRLEHVPLGSTWIRRQGLGVSGDSEGRKVALDGSGTGRADFRFGPLALSGSLLRAGLPLEAADLSIQQPPDADGGKAGRSRFQAATTDEEGRFVLPGLEPGPARLTVNSGGQSLVLLIEVPEGGATGLDLDLPARIVEGVVLNESGKPISGACVGSPLRTEVPPDLAPQFQPAEGDAADASASPVWSRVTTGKDGHFRVAVDDPAPSTLAVCTCAQGCVEVPLDAVRDGDPVTLWFDPRLKRKESEAK